MGFLDRLLGRDKGGQQPTGQWGQQPPAQPEPYPQEPSQPTAYPGSPTPQERARPASEDERAIARYRYLLRTAPPEQVEQMHAEAFARLTPEQRQQVLQTLSTDLPPEERPQGDDPQAMARAATRAEMRQPGTLQRSFAGPGFGSVLGGSLLGTIAGVVVGSVIAQSLLGGYEQSPEAAEAGEAGAEDAGAESGDAAGGEAGTGEAAAGDPGAADAGAGGADQGGDPGADFGGDLGGDFGGDFGGFGDF
ncbi:hypothetical protein [Ornithinimicrobium cavernae]|uniref:hypothetical protein n=1 Tax=Ornithinimicrobium cavernae TaxID=2666047 RepID=UPI000D686639|nr:hypothetical protein [Ornithinimicrobium cavernae]